jgi:hypothetical protein
MRIQAAHISIQALISLSLLFWTNAAVGAPLRFEVSGTVRSTAYYSDGRVLTNQAVRFEAAINGKEWFIRTVYGEQHSVEYGTDGTNVFQLLHDLTRPGAGSSLVRSGVILPGTYPTISEGWTALVWWAYCSAPYLTATSNAFNLLCPWLDPVRDIRTHTLRMEPSEIDAATGLPAKVRFVVDAERLASAPANRLLNSAVLRENKARDEIALIRHLEPGFAAGEIEIITWTNRGELRVPSLFKATQRAFPDPGLPGGWVFAEYFGELHSLTTPPQRSSYLPDIGGREVSVGDFRLNDKDSNVDYINYRITNSTWPVVPGEEHRTLFEKRRAAFQRHYREPVVDRKLVFVLIIVTLVVPAVFLLSKHLKSQRPNRKDMK